MWLLNGGVGQDERKIMAMERVGIRRLFDALGCSTESTQEIRISFPLLKDCVGSLYIGPKPPLGVMVLEPTDHYVIPGKQCKIMQTSCDYDAGCFIEITIILDIAVDESISAGLARNEEWTKNALLDEVEKRKEVFSGVLDCICGLVGLKFHRQFILKPLFENPFIASGPEPVTRFAGDFVEVLESVNLTESGLTSLKSYLELFRDIKEKEYADASRVLQWLLRAWRERDPIAKFLYLFIPLECILESPERMDGETRTNFTILQELVNTSNHVAKTSLLAFLRRIQSKFAPTLNSRFEALAKAKGISGWEADIKAFKKFNHTRNLLLHAGHGGVEYHLNIGEETRTLEDLVERYVALSLFGSPDVYQSTWRPKRLKEIEAVSEAS